VKERNRKKNIQLVGSKEGSKDPRARMLSRKVRVKAVSGCVAQYCDSSAPENKKMEPKIE
jgi:hypothetical protein